MSSTVPRASTLPESGTARLPDGRVYTVAGSGSDLVLDDIRVRLRSLTWRPVTDPAIVPPGTRALAVITLSVGNLGSTARTILPTQFWLLDAARHEFLAEARSRTPDALIGTRVASGGSVHGTLVFPTPRRFSSGTVLVYRFADAAAIAHASHVGILRLG
jgi:Domain of unknown function (DUF4352)